MKNTLSTQSYVVPSRLRIGFMAFVLASIFAANSVRAAGTPPVVDEAIWGFYARLAGKSVHSEGGYTIRWSWTKPNEELLEEYVIPETGAVNSTVVVMPGAQAGEFRIKSSNFGGKFWNGIRQADGSVVYVGEGMMKFPFSVTVDDNGAYEHRRVKVKGKELVSSGPATRFLPATSAGSSAVAATVPNASTATVAGTSRSLANPTANKALVENTAPTAQQVATWGPLAGLPGTVWATGSGSVVVNRFEWSDDKTTIRFRSGSAGRSGTQIDFRPGRLPNTLVADVTTVSGEKTANIPFHFDSAGVLVSEWYQLSGANMRNELRFSGGAYESREVLDQQAKPDFPPLHGSFRRLSVSNAAPVVK